jgi:hypothetical protein
MPEHVGARSIRPRSRDPTLCSGLTEVRTHVLPFSFQIFFPDSRRILFPFRRRSFIHAHSPFSLSLRANLDLLSRR